MFNWKKKTALLLAGLAMAGSAFAADVPLALDAKQFEARNGAKVNWKNGVLDLKIHNPEWSGGVRINPPAGQKFKRRARLQKQQPCRPAPPRGQYRHRPESG